MDYYEELGLTKAATEDEIHKAHRRMSKLLHPDQQTDTEVKALAETQMRRLNGIVQVLSNRESRFQYDRDKNLERAARSLVRYSGPVMVPHPYSIPHPPHSNRSITTWALCSALGAILFTLSGVWWWESRSGALFANQVQAYDSRVAESLNPEADFKPSTDVAAHKSMAGEWVYIPQHGDTRSGVYLPDFISLRLTEVAGQLKGVYRARYAVIDKPVPPDVEFALVPQGAEGTYNWQSSSGAQGTFRITAIGDNLIRTSWETTVYTRDTVLTSGAATLVRRRQS